MEVKVLNFIDDKEVHNDLKYVREVSQDDLNVWLSKLTDGNVHPLSVCFTGLRPQSLEWKFNEECDMCVEYKQKLANVIENLILNGYYNFISGMALGVDMYATEIVLTLRKKYKNIKLTCYVPCLNQDVKWAGEYKKKYKEFLQNADNVVYVSEKNYFQGCYQIRNKKMVDNADLVVAGFSKNNQGKGTKSTVDYARKMKKPVLVVDL